MPPMMHIAFDVLRGALHRGTIRRLVFLDLVMLVGTGWWLTGLGSDLPREPEQFERLLSQLTVALSVLLVLVAIPLGSRALERDRDSGSLQAILVHPIGRGQYLVGKWTGLNALVGGNAVVVLLAASSIGVVVPGYVPHPSPAILVYEAASIAILLALVIALAVALGPFTAWTGTLLLASAAGYLHAAPTVAADARALAPILLPTWWSWGGVVSVAAPDATFPWAAAPTPAQLVLSAVWVALALRVAALSLARADL